MSLKTSHSDANVVVEEALTVTYSQSVIQGSWGYTSANVSGYYTTMREVHRYARKSFRYVGMTFAAAKACRAAMVAKFARAYKTSYWDADTMGGAWSARTVLYLLTMTLGNAAGGVLGPLAGRLLRR